MACLAQRPQIQSRCSRDYQNYWHWRHYRCQSNVSTSSSLLAPPDRARSDMGSNAAHLKAAITALPELTARKATLDAHMNVASALLEGIKDRGLDTLYQLEESGISRSAKPALLEALGKEAKGSPEDKLRLLICLYLASPDGAISKDDLTEYERALRDTGVDMGAWEYVKKCAVVFYYVVDRLRSAQDSRLYSNVFLCSDSANDGSSC